MNKPKTVNKLNLERGFVFLYLKNRPKPYALRITLVGSSGQTSYATEKERLIAYNDKRREIKNKGVENYLVEKSFKFTNEEILLYKKFIELGGTLTTAISLQERYGKITKRISVKDCFKLFYDSLLTRKVEKGTLGHYNTVINKFNALYGSEDIGAITRNSIEIFLKDVRDYKNVLLCDETKNSYLRKLKTIFAYSVTGRFITDAPTNGIKQIYVPPKDVEVVSLDDIKQIFKANTLKDLNREVIGRFALECFAGVRVSTVSMTQPSYIKIEDNKLALDFPAFNKAIPPERITKDGKRHYIDGLPENLRYWLEWSNYKSWKMESRQYIDAKRLALIRAGVVIKHNAIRHTFCSNHVSCYQSKDKTAILMFHTGGTEILNKHYLGEARQEIGKAYFEIMPPIDA